MTQPKENQKSHQTDVSSMNKTSPKRKSLLVVDDESIILDSLSRELVSAGFKVTTAKNGEEAIARIKDDFFDLVTTDLLMPGLDGFQVLKAAKKRNLQTMVIILTGYGVMESAIDALRLGADDFLKKPCDTDELLFRISNCFVKQELLRKIAIYENFLRVCSYCKRIRDDRPGEYGKGRWHSLEEHFSTSKRMKVSHGCCPDCFAEQTRDFLPGKDQA